LQTLLEMTRDPVPGMADLPFDLLARIGPVAAPLVPDLLADLDAAKDDGGPGLVRLPDVLAAIGRPALPGLLERTLGEDPARAARALGKMGGMAAPAVAGLLARARTGDRAAIEALGFLGPAAREAGRPLGVLLKRAEREGPAANGLRIALLDALARIGEWGDEGARTITSLMEDGDPLVRVHAARAVLLARGATAGECRPLAVLMEVARSPRPGPASEWYGEDYPAARGAIDALGEVGPAARRATPLLWRILERGRARAAPGKPDFLALAAYGALARIWSD
jgi:hypothetical protein